MSEINNNEATSTLVSELLKENRSAKRWKNIRFVFWFALFTYTIYGIFQLAGEPTVPITTGEKHVALIRLSGMIAPDRDFSAEQILPVLKEAFADKNAKS